MNTCNWIYNGIPLHNMASGYYAIQSAIYDINLNTSVFDRINYHGSYTSNTLATGRLFSFKGKIEGTLEQKREAYTTLSNLIKPEGLPSDTNRGFYTLSWTDEGGNEVQTEAKVFKGFTRTPDEINGMDFEFELYSESAVYYSQELNVVYSDSVDGGTSSTTTFEEIIDGGTASDTEFEYILNGGYSLQDVDGGFGTIGGTLLGTTLGTLLNAKVGSITLNNNGNTEAPIYINIVGSIENPKLYSVTRNEFYKVNYTTTDYVLDNRARPFIVTDNGTNISSYRTSGSKFIYLSPGENELILLGDNFTVGNSVTVSILYRDTYI